jgi:NRPS condensation-like uncharacterized protein
VKRATAMVLPLPLAPFEHYMLCDDRPAHPMHFFFRLGFAGRLHEADFRSAWQTAVHRHPLLCAQVDRQVGRPRWMPAQGVPRLDWTTDTSAAIPAGMRTLNLLEEPGVRAMVRAGEERTEVLLQFHHSCCDGMGTLSFLEDLLIAYAAQQDPRIGKHLKPLDPETLRRRGTFGLTPWRLLRMAPQQAVGLLGARQFLARRPSPLADAPALPANQPLPEDYPSSTTRWLTADETTELRNAAKTLRVSTNDLLLSHLFGAIFQWRQRHASPRPDDWLRLSVPMNMRTDADRRLPAANVVSMVFLDRRAADVENFDALAASVHDEIQLIKRLQLGLTFVLSLKVADFLGILPRMCSAQKCRATAVLSNLGTLFQGLPVSGPDGIVRLSGAALDQIEVLPPLRPFTYASVVVFFYGGRAGCTWHFDSRMLKAEQAAELADDFQSRLRMRTT